MRGLVERPDEELPLALLDGLPVGERLRVLGEIEPSVGESLRSLLTLRYPTSRSW